MATGSAGKRACYCANVAPRGEDRWGRGINTETKIRDTMCELQEITKDIRSWQGGWGLCFNESQHLKEIGQWEISKELNSMLVGVWLTYCANTTPYYTTTTVLPRYASWTHEPILNLLPNASQLSGGYISYSPLIAYFSLPGAPWMTTAMNNTSREKGAQKWHSASYNGWINHRINAAECQQYNGPLQLFIS